MYNLKFQLYLVSMSWRMLTWYSSSSTLNLSGMWPQWGYNASHYNTLLQEALQTGGIGGFTIPVATT